MANPSVRMKVSFNFYFLTFNPLFFHSLNPDGDVAAADANVNAAMHRKEIVSLRNQYFLGNESKYLPP